MTLGMQQKLCKYHASQTYFNYLSIISQFTASLTVVTAFQQPISQEENNKANYHTWLATNRKEHNYNAYKKQKLAFKDYLKLPSIEINYNAIS